MVKVLLCKWPLVGFPLIGLGTLVLHYHTLNLILVGSRMVDSLISGVNG